MYIATVLKRVCTTSKRNLLEVKSIPQATFRFFL